ncbi:MAG: CPBP family intramembrane metalloprotease [Ruminococcaceae bacterium]|nr:CPBP family intramembrane metalloprotease [Oscillospiraceae bacterium]
MKKISIFRTICGTICAIAVLIISQAIALILGELGVIAGFPSTLGNVIAGVLYIILTYFGVKLICCKILGVSLQEMRITKISVKPVWLISAIIMPALVCVAYFITPGRWQINNFSTAENLSLITNSLFFYSLGAGVVEEMIFRGVIMTALERRWNKTSAVIIPSVLFGVVHIIGSSLDALSTVQLIAAGTVVGILFSLVTYHSSIWSAALMHALWNFSIIGLLHIGTEPHPSAIFNYILRSDSFLITGGDFGIEASVYAISAYCLFIVLAIFMIKRGKIRREE